MRRNPSRQMLMTTAPASLHPNHTPCSPFNTPLSPCWAALLKLATDPYIKSHLKRLFRLASYLNLLPHEVNDETLERLEQEAIAAGITRPTQVARDAAHGWNKMRALYSQWPRQELNAPNHRKFVSIKLEEMPKAFQEDVEKFFNTDIEVDIFEAPTRLIKSRVTINDSTNKIMQLVTRAVELGVSLKSIRRLIDLSLPEISGPILEKLYEDAGQKPHAHSNRLAKLLLRIAKNANEPNKEHIICLERAERKLRVKDKGISKKMWDRLRILLDEENAAKILLLAEDVIAKIDRKSPKMTDAWMVQSALIVSLLLRAPMKEAILASLDIDKHIIKISKNLYLIKISEEETANGLPLEYELTGNALKILKLYLKVYRPLLAQTPTTKLLISRAGRQKPGYELAAQIPKFIEKHTGLKMNIGLFRHFVAVLYIHKNKNDTETLRRILSHVFSETIYTFYQSFIKQHSFDALDRLIQDGYAEFKNA